MVFKVVSLLRVCRCKPLAPIGRMVFVGIAIVSAVTCAKRIPEPPNLAPGTPHITWIIMYGDADNPDQQFACQSDPRTECVVPPSRPDAQIFSDIHVYYHGAGTETTYAGSFRVGFLQGSSASTEFQVKNVIKKNEEIYNQSVHGLVTSSPGIYKLTFNVTPTLSEGGRRQAIRQEASVTVK